MFSNQDLLDYFKTSEDISIQSLVLAEWNLNISDNIEQIGNYRYRPTDSTSLYNSLTLTYDKSDAGSYFTDATLSYVTVADKVDNSEVPQSFEKISDKYSMHYSLESCIEPFRPRSGINKLLFLNGKNLPANNYFGGNRPRYYLSSKDDQFKYWTSYRKEGGQERGIANKKSNGLNMIDDACPFVVYKEEIPTNRIVIKLQTNIGSINTGSIQTSYGSMQDPFYIESNKTVPSRFKIQVLKNNSWVDVFSSLEGRTRSDGTPIFGADGYLELEYRDGSWGISTGIITSNSNFVTNISDPLTSIDSTTGLPINTEFEYIRGIRLAVQSMNKFDSCLDLIEISPRLLVDLSDRVLNYKVTKVLSDMSSGPLPVGQLLASVGELVIFDDERSFNPNNTNSIVHKYIDKNVKIQFFENIYDDNAIDYLVPIKTMYSDGFLETNQNEASVKLFLRDFYFYLESMTAPQMLLTDISLSYAVSVLLDSVGFSNYTFKRVDGEVDNIIPYFFVAPNQNIAQVLNELAISTQNAMFFDEYNNLVIMSKRYMMPEVGERETDFTLIGTDNSYQDGLVKNQITANLPNILSFSSDNKQVYNDGKIDYTTRYIQRQYASINQAGLIDQEKTWTYKPALLWEASGDDATKSINQQVSKQSKYVLGAMPLNTDLTDDVPVVVENQLINNVFDVGENVYYLTRYNGYLYSSGEIIRYDAAQFNISGIGNVWISSNAEYQDYFSKLPFNGKIYPTGLLRIFCTPFYETVNGISQLRNGNVLEHGRGQFGTNISYHYAGIANYWSDNNNIRGCNMKSNYLFTTEVDPALPSTTTGAAGVSNVKAKEATRNGIIKNFLSTAFLSETEINNLKATQTGTIQSSALIVTGPKFNSDEKPIDFVSYVYKPLSDSYKHFGTRMRIVGKVENDNNSTQSPYGGFGYYQIAGKTPDLSPTISGGSGGLAVLLNQENNNGYYFEIVALSEKNIDSYMRVDDNGQSSTIINNVVFYKIKKDAGSNDAIPIKLWGGIAGINVDSGQFAGQYRFVGDENPTVYDMSVEYINIGSTRRFYLYLNNSLIATVDDKDPLPLYNSMALFTRGSSKCMFENIYALTENYSQNTTFNVAESPSVIFGKKDINVNDAFSKYSMSGIIQSTYLSGISSQQSPQYNMYFEEFGTIMRECSYFNVKYDKAYPALYAKISPTFNNIKGYVVSGFYANSYGAEFLIFNATDAALNLDETTGNYLRIQGITFTQDTTHSLTVDDYFNKKSNLSSPESVNSDIIRSQNVELQKYDQIKQSRLNYGMNTFSLSMPYIQTSGDAEDILGWIINKSMMPKRLLGVNIFATPILQLGDIVNVDYVKDGMDIIAEPSKQFIVYNITYSRSISGPDMTVYLAEV